jgi:hypothetical protein
MGARARFLIAVVVLGMLMTGPFVVTALLVWLGVEGEGRDLLLQVIVPHLPLGTFMTVLGFIVGVAVVRNLFRQYVQGLLRMAENQHLMLGANRDFRVDETEGPPEVQALARTANALAAQRDALLQDVEAQIERAKKSVEDEKNRLAALMSELTQSVVVCNLDGRILLYNSRARQQFRALSNAPPGCRWWRADRSSGRSIYAVVRTAS